MSNRLTLTLESWNNNNLSAWFIKARYSRPGGMFSFMSPQKDKINLFRRISHERLLKDFACWGCSKSENFIKIFLRVKPLQLTRFVDKLFTFAQDHFSTSCVLTFDIVTGANFKKKSQKLNPTRKNKETLGIQRRISKYAATLISSQSLKQC